MARFASVYPLVTARAVARPFTYEVPDEVERGAIVDVRFGNARRRGVATGGNVLLHGATGSGKTEVYIRACEAALARARSAIVLVPEIALTPQTLGRFRIRFGDRVAVLHSALSDAERRDERERIVRGEAPLVVGAR